MLRKPLFIFYFLFFYAIMQLIWWGVLLAQIAPERKAMFIGEGLFFFVIFITSAIIETIKVRSKNNSLYVVVW